MENQGEERKTYELGYLLSPLIAPEMLAETIEKEIKHWLKEAGAEVKSEVAPRARTLAYPIKKIVEHKGSTFREAYFGSLHFTCEPAKLALVEEGLKKSALLIRSLIITLSPKLLAAMATRPRPPRPETPAPTIEPATSANPPARAGASASRGKMTTEAIDKEIEELLTPAA